MNNEIKEIITRMASYTIHYDCCSEGDAEEDIEKLLDYINNLQQENERLKQEYVNIKNYIVLRNVDSAVQDKATLYNIELENINKKKYLDYKSRCDKAIEYLEQPYRDNFDYSKAELLNILEGKNE